MTTSDSTTRATDDIRLVDGPDDALAARLDAELAELNFDATGIRDARDFAAALHDEGGALMAGVQGWTWGATCWVERLWVHADARHRGLGRRWVHADARPRGLGRRLIMAVESEARARGCGQLALTTHSFQAPDFYRR